MSTSEWASFTDEELVPQAQNGDQPAFAELIRRHKGGCLKLALSILRDRSDAEDEAQNALWKAFQHLNQFQRDARFSTWLTRIVVNQCLMKIRRDRRAKFLYLDDTQIGEETGTLDLPGHGDSPEQELGKKEVAGVIGKEVGRIPPLLRNVFMLREVQRLPMGEVAERLGISVPAAKSRLLRARMELRNRLQKHQGRLGAATLFAS
jgi:RNA polymerase sigma-70 factor, ECF subfamily